jgi:hypothetical protein
MEVFIAFELDPGRNPLKQLARALCGPQVRAELLVRRREGAEITTYRARLFHCFEAGVHSEPGHYTERTHDIFRVTGLSREDSERVCRTCRACVRKRIPYNARDMMLAGTMAPTFHNDPQPDPRDVFSAESLYCAQSVVLILRGCLPPAHPLGEALASVNSRAVTPARLCELVQPLCARAVWQDSR